MLIVKWRQQSLILKNRRQQLVAKQATFDDDPRNGFQVKCQVVSGLDGVKPLDRRSHDYDNPAPSFLDPDTLQVEGLRRIAGIDLSYRKTDTEDGQAVAALAILDYPSLAVNSDLKPS